MRDKVILITGGGAGLGKASAIGLAHLNAAIVILGRNKEHLDKTVEEIKETTNNNKIYYVLADLNSLQSVRSATEDFRRRFEKLDVLINNAATNSPSRIETIDGFEIHFGVNYLSHYLLTRLLLDLIEKSAPSRIINVGARQMGTELDFDDLQTKIKWAQFKAITRAKLAMFLFTRELAKRLSNKNVTANIVDPGLVKTSYHKQFGPIQRFFVKLIGTSPETAVKTYLYLASSPEVKNTTGRLFYNMKEIPFKGQALDDNIAKKLWEVSENLTKLNT